MKLLTRGIIRALPPICATDNIPLENKIVICKFFTPDSNWTWYVFEGERDTDAETQTEDFRFFGMAHGFREEMGYFLFSELLKVRGKLGLPIERDRSVFKVSYREIMAINY